MVTEPAVLLLATAGLTMVLCLLLTPLALRFGLLDHPSGRKVHNTSIPLVGGLAIYIALVMVTTLATTYAYEAMPLAH